MTTEPSLSVLEGDIVKAEPAARRKRDETTSQSVLSCSHSE